MSRFDFDARESNINDPDFFSDDVLNQRATAARPSDYGPGPNESLEDAQAMSYSLRRAQQLGQPAVPAMQDWAAPPAPAAPAGGDMVDQIAEAVLQRVMEKLNQGE